MGCDIHLFVEYKDENGRWWKCKEGFKSDMYDEESDYFNTDRYKNSDTPYSGRSYVIFSYLADVRNGSGVAGCDTGDRLEPMDEPRGLPSDVSLAIQEESDSWGIDGHSHSYFTLAELKDAFEKSKNITLVKRGWVKEDEYKDFKLNGSPYSWCGGVSGHGVRHISNEEMDRRIEEKDFDKGLGYYTKIEWQKPLSEVVKYFFEHVIPQLEDWDWACEKREDDEIRVVFWFDN